MTTPATPSRDERLHDLTTEQLEQTALAVEEQIREVETDLTRLRFLRCDIADHMIRIRGEYRIKRWAGHLGVTFQALRPQLDRFWRQNGTLFNPDTRPEITAKDEAEILARYRKGDAMYKIAKDYGIAPVTVSRIVGHVPRRVAKPAVEANGTVDA